MLVPPGDHVGLAGKSDWSVSRVTLPVPSASIVATVARSSSCRMNAIFLPSGDQEGSWALIWLPAVSYTHLTLPTILLV